MIIIKGIYAIVYYVYVNDQDIFPYNKTNSSLQLYFYEVFFIEQKKCNSQTLLSEIQISKC